MFRRLALPLAALALAGTACEKPSPYVTLFAGDRVVKSRAHLYCHTPDDCRERPGDVVLRMSGRQEIGIDVPGEVAESGWRILEEQAEAVSHERYRRLPPLTFAAGQRQTLTVVEVGKDGQAIKGRWRFVIVGE